MLKQGYPIRGWLHLDRTAKPVRKPVHPTKLNAVYSQFCFCRCVARVYNKRAVAINIEGVEVPIRRISQNGKRIKMLFSKRVGLVNHSIQVLLK